jgi:steroid delta-isomerase-like uncharacterized protein
MNHPKLNAQEDNKSTVRRLYDECFNQQKYAVADQFIAPGWVNPGPDGGTGPNGFKANAARLLTAFPDVQFTVHDLIAENDLVAVHWTWEGTHRGPFNNIPPTNRRVRQEGMVMYRFDGGKVADSKVIFDRLGVFQQLGVMPQKPGASTTVEPGKAGAPLTLEYSRSLA